MTGLDHQLVAGGQLGEMLSTPPCGARSGPSSHVGLLGVSVRKTGTQGRRDRCPNSGAHRRLLNPGPLSSPPRGLGSVLASVLRLVALQPVLACTSRRGGCHFQTAAVAAR